MLWADALGTKYYLEVSKAAVYCYLDKSISPEQRLEDIWYATFFQILAPVDTITKTFTLKNNYNIIITSNSYMCVEVNAHSLLVYTIMMRDNHADQPEVFTPWLMGSQSCEQKFRILRSITGTFSTMINFSLLGMTQRLYKLSINEVLQSQSEAEKHNIRFPRLEAHHKKIGHGRQRAQSFSYLTDEFIYNTLKTAEKRAKEAVSILGMAEDLERKKMFETPPISKSIHENEVEDDDSDIEEGGERRQ